MGTANLRYRASDDLHDAHLATARAARRRTIEGGQSIGLVLLCEGADHRRGRSTRDQHVLPRLGGATDNPGSALGRSDPLTGPWAETYGRPSFGGSRWESSRRPRRSASGGWIQPWCGDQAGDNRIDLRRIRGRRLRPSSSAWLKSDDAATISRWMRPPRRTLARDARSSIRWREAIAEDGPPFGLRPVAMAPAPNPSNEDAL